MSADPENNRRGILNVGQPHRLSGRRPWSCFVMDGSTVLSVHWGLTAKAAQRRAERRLVRLLVARYA